MKSRLLKSSFLVVGSSLVLTMTSLASVDEGVLKDTFAALMNFTLNETQPVFPQIRMYAGRTATQRTCVVTQSAGSRASQFEVITLDRSGSVDSEPLGYEFSMRRKYDMINVAVTGNGTKGQLNLSARQSLAGTTQVAYDLVIGKGLKGLTDFRITYRNLSARMSHLPQSLECLKLSPILTLNPSNLGSLAGAAKSIYERNEKDRLGAYLKTIVPKCELESASILSCEFAFESARIPDYLKVTYSFSQKGLGKMIAMSLTQGH